MPGKKSATKKSTRRTSRSRSPSPTRHSKKHHASSRKHKSSENKPKRPLSAYMFFNKEERARVLKAHPTYKVTDVAKEVGRIWREMTESEKKPYVAASDKDKIRYAKETGRHSE